jgi:hypothetical protein
MTTTLANYLQTARLRTEASTQHHFFHRETVGETPSIFLFLKDGEKFTTQDIYTKWVERISIQKREQKKIQKREQSKQKTRTSPIKSDEGVFSKL